MKNSEVNNKHKKMGSSRLFYPFVFQAQEIPKWEINEAQGHNI